MTTLRLPVYARAALSCLIPASMLAQQARDFGAASFVAPPGWAVDSRPALQTFTYIRAPHRCMVLLSADESATGPLGATFARVWSTAFNANTYREPDPPPGVERTSPAGYRHVVGERELEDRAGNRFIVRLHVFPVGQKIQSVVLIGSSRAALDECRQGWDTFFTSLRFPSVAADSPMSPAGASTRTNATAPPATPPTATPSTTSPSPNAVADRGPQRFDNVTFAPPAGWSMRRAGGVVELTPVDTKPMERLQVLLLPGHRAAVPVARELEAGWAEVRSLLGAELMLTVNRVPYDVEQATRSLRGTEYVRASGGMRRGDGTYSVNLYVFQAGDRVERAAVVSRDFRDNTVMVTSESNPAYSRAIRELLFTMTFANQPQRQPARAALTSGGIVGVWAGLSMSTGRIEPNFAIFFDNGLAYFGPKFPANGLFEIDPVIEQPAQVRSWGTYSMAGDAGTLTMPYGTIPLRTLGAALELTTNRTPHRFVRLSMPDGPLDGTWCLSGGACLRLTPAGRFEDNGVVRVVEHSTYAFPSTPAGGQGRYAIRAHTLILTYDSGPEIRVGFAGLPSDRRSSSPSEIRLGYEADMLIRR